MNKKLWGGRFSKKTNALVEDFTKSIHYDYKIGQCDILGSIIHVQILEKAKYLNHEEAIKLINGLKSIHEKMKSVKFSMNCPAEDIHSWIQNELQKKLGNIAKKLHTARSRNDQVVFSTKVYALTELKKITIEVDNFLYALEVLADRNKDLIIPGYTHLQHAQPVYLKDYLNAYARMLKRDKNRLNFIFNNLELTLGSGALAGTPIDARNYNLKAIALQVEATSNSLDSVSDRDFVIEILSALSIQGMHLSRLAEDFIIWSTQEFGFIELDDSFCTGSSLMPQKKNPDILELIRGYAGRLYGNLVSVLTMMKGLSLTYNRDMQLDKEPLFNSLEIASSELKVLAGMLRGVKFNKERIEERLADESLYATDLVYYLVDKGVAFEDAHAIVGKLVRYSLDNKMLIKTMPDSLLRSFSQKLVKGQVVKLFSPLASVKAKKSIKR
ncbi:MAG: argininosuccinate lyase [Candidatus Omnitrophota bacterium]|nr:argininosuccinate lyase [Candidatus Omnitrophota bacterium]